VDPRIRKRVREALGGVKGNKNLNAAVARLYKARSEFVHTGNAMEPVDIQLVRQAFVHASLCPEQGFSRSGFL